MILKAYVYILLKGLNIERATEKAVLNSNYLMEKLRSSGFKVPFYGPRMHEFVLTLSEFRNRGIRATDIAKRLLDYGIHPPTIYFPLIVEEAFMIEPTEDENKQTLDRFVQAMKEIADEDELTLKNAPMTMPVGRVNELLAAKNLVLTWKDIQTIYQDR